MFTPEDRAAVSERVLEIARADGRITGGALTGSAAAGRHDGWSDVDVAFGSAHGVQPDAVLEDWTALFEREFGVVHHWELRGGSTVYRVFLLRNGLELDVGIVPAAEFGARAPSFRLVFGEAAARPPLTEPDADHLIGLGWHHALHAHAAIERGQPWKAEFYVSALKDHALALACLRFGERAEYARGIDRLPGEVTAPYEPALVRSLDPSELRRALSAAVELFLAEVEETDSELADRLRTQLTRLSG
jgi:hypothetical protein